MIRWMQATEAERRQAEAETWFYLPEDRGKRVEAGSWQIWAGKWRDVLFTSRVVE